ncbi:CRISPR-associated endonuclease Cas2 [Thermococcus sp.]|uniref:CRISPR-associated endonuclease Cas2 n=1 Tax=Thermococcus sp. TaxID=35749 RepID=UPI0025FDB1A8|nr:CRISPR-associated endonuclease Cas2 [Thermococcus sp.]
MLCFVNKFLRQHLHWVQNSVFEGEITRAEFERIKVGLEEPINEDEDSVVICKLRSMPQRETMGVEKNSLRILSKITPQEARTP